MFNLGFISGKSSPFRWLAESSAISGSAANLYYSIVSPDNLFLYVAIYEQTAIGVFSIGEDGNLTEVSKTTLPVTAGNNCAVIGMSPDGNHVYGFSVGSLSQPLGIVYSVNKTTGALTQVSTFAVAIATHDFVISPDGTTVYVSSSFPTSYVEVFTRNPSTGALTKIQSIPTGAVVGFGIALCSGLGYFYQAEYTTNSLVLYSVSAVDGTLTKIESIDSNESNPNFITISSDETVLFVSNHINSSISKYSINQINGKLTYVETVTSNTITDSPVYGSCLTTDNNTLVLVSGLYLSSTTVGVGFIPDVASVRTGSSSVGYYAAPDKSGRFIFVSGHNTITTYEVI